MDGQQALRDTRMSLGLSIEPITWSQLLLEVVTTIIWFHVDALCSACFS